MGLSSAVAWWTTYIPGMIHIEMPTLWKGSYINLMPYLRKKVNGFIKYNLAHQSTVKHQYQEVDHSNDWSFRVI